MKCKLCGSTLNQVPGGITYCHGPRNPECMFYKGPIMAEELEDYIKIYDKWRDDGMKAVGIADWAHAAKCFKECAFYAAIIDWIKRRAKQ